MACLSVGWSNSRASNAQTSRVPKPSWSGGVYPWSWGIRIVTAFIDCVIARGFCVLAYIVQGTPGHIVPWNAHVIVPGQGCSTPDSASHTQHPSANGLAGLDTYLHITRRRLEPRLQRRTDTKRHLSFKCTMTMFFLAWPEKNEVDSQLATSLYLWYP